MNVGLSDADLGPRIAAGDREAEAEMCRRMGPRIRLYGLRHLRSPSAADDLVQQVLLKVLEALRSARLREPDKLFQFVLGTCRMTVLDLRRSSYRQEALLVMFGGDLVPDPPPIPRLDDRQLARCVQALKERERAPSSNCAPAWEPRCDHPTLRRPQRLSESHRGGGSHGLLARRPTLRS